MCDIIISDLHLGSDACQAKAILSFLHKINHHHIPVKTLILNGDIFDSWNFKRLKHSHWKVLSEIRHLSKKIKVIWICGNHDGPSNIISHILGTEMYDQYIINNEYNKILILHGDVFDSFISAHPIITFIADIFYRLLQKIDPSFWIARKTKHAAKTYLRCTERIRDRAIEYAKKYGCNIVCCGHTHLAVMCTQDDITYVNSGCWTEKPQHYIVIDEDVVDIERHES